MAKKKQVYNPYLPLGVYIPDGEPHVFGDRVYVYGSHDATKAEVYCPGHYNVWSASVDDLTEWKDEGISYLRTQDPSNKNDTMQLWAPDVTRGPDGRYYLYYCFSFYPEIGVAVSDSPAGPFEFYGHVKYADDTNGGAVLKEFMPFDPAVLTDDDGRVYLYYGFAPAEEKEMKVPEVSDEELAAMPKKQREIFRVLRETTFGENSMAVELEADMITMKGIPKPCIPGGHHTKGTGFEGHGFFEASSVRKINGRYYFVYSSHKSHELCYAVSDHPMEGYRYGGILISNGNVGLPNADGTVREHPDYTLSNNHGGLVKIGDDDYVFYHRATDGSEYSRQGCAEKVTILPDGSIPQVQTTSCGLGDPLTGDGIYPAVICCHMTSPTTTDYIDYTAPICKEQTRITEANQQLFVTDIEDGTVLGYRFFDFGNEPSERSVLLELRGTFDGEVVISNEEHGEAIGTVTLSANAEEWTNVVSEALPVCGVQAVYLTFRGTGTLEMKSLGWIRKGQKGSIHV